MNKYYILKPKQKRHSIRWKIGKPQEEFSFYYDAKNRKRINSFIYNERPEWTKTKEGIIKHFREDIK